MENFYQTAQVIHSLASPGGKAIWLTDVHHFDTILFKSIKGHLNVHDHLNLACIMTIDSALTFTLKSLISYKSMDENSI